MNLIDDKEEYEFVYDIDIQRCKHAEVDHMRDSRVYAHTGCEPMMICVSSSIEMLSIENIVGIMLHEIGHIIHLERYGEDGLEGDPEIIADSLIQDFGIHIYYDRKKIQHVSFEQFDVAIKEMETKIW